MIILILGEKIKKMKMFNSVKFCDLARIMQGWPTLRFVNSGQI